MKKHRVIIGIGILLIALLAVGVCNIQPTMAAERDGNWQMDRSNPGIDGDSYLDWQKDEFNRGNIWLKPGKNDQQNHGKKLERTKHDRKSHRDTRNEKPKPGNSRIDTKKSDKPKIEYQPVWPKPAPEPLQPKQIEKRRVAPQPERSFPVKRDLSDRQPDPPRLTAYAGEHCDMNLHWTEVNNAKTYFIYRSTSSCGNFSLIAKLDGCYNSYTDHCPKPDVRYYYRVECYDRYGRRCCSDYSWARDRILEAPSCLRAVSITNSRVKLAWADNSSDETGFRIERRQEDDNCYEVVEEVGRNETTYIDYDVDPDTTYYYRVRAYNAYRTSAYCSSAEVATSYVYSSEKAVRYYIGSRTYFIDDQADYMDCVPIIKQGRTLLPIRFIASPFGAYVTWNNSERKTTIKMNGNTIEIWAGRNWARVNGDYQMIDPDNPGVKAIVVPPGRVMLPLRFIAENLECFVDWNPWAQEVKVLYPGS